MCWLTKKYLTSISCEHKPFLQLNWLDDFATNIVANLFIYERLNIPETYTEPSQKCKIELFAKIVNGKKPLTNLV